MRCACGKSLRMCITTHLAISLLQLVTNGQKVCRRKVKRCSTELWVRLHTMMLVNACHVAAPCGAAVYCTGCHTSMSLPIPPEGDVSRERSPTSGKAPCTCLATRLMLSPKLREQTNKLQAGKHDEQSKPFQYFEVAVACILRCPQGCAGRPMREHLRWWRDCGPAQERTY